MSAFVEYSPEQLAAIAAVMRWVDDPTTSQRLTLGGYAGTGKTTIIKAIVHRLGDRCSVAAFTGKAAFVLRSKGVDGAMTLHKLMYSPMDLCRSCGMFDSQCNAYNDRCAELQRTNPSRASAHRPCPRIGKKTGWALTATLTVDLVIVDEASMLNRRMMTDLESLGKKVLYVGDHGQLEPVGDDPQLMVSPDLRLEKIHRQAEGSSVIRFAHELRRGGLPQYFKSDPQVTIRNCAPRDISGFDAVLCGYNKTRVQVNARVRKRRGYWGTLPQPSERVICLRNNTDLGIFNGMQATVTGIQGNRMSVVDDVGTEYSDLLINPHQFGMEKPLKRGLDEDETLWDFGYAMTVHKSQGSEWANVCVLEQLAPIWSPARWRYTAATRASETITYCARA